MALLIKLMHKRFIPVIMSISASILALFVSLWWNRQLSGIVYKINSGIDIPAASLAAAVVAMLLSVVSSYAMSLCSAWACEYMAHDLRMGFARYFTTLSLAEIEKVNVGEQMSKLQNEISEVAGFLNANMFTFISDLIRFTGTFAWLLWLNPKLTLIAFIPTVFQMWYTVYTSRAISEAAQQSQHANGRLNGFAESLVAVFPVMKMFDAVQLVRSKYDAVLEEWERAAVRQERRRAALMSPSGLMSCIPLLLLLAVGGMQVVSGELSTGGLFVFINLSGNVSGVMMNMPGRIASFRRFAVNMERIEPYMATGFSAAKDDWRSGVCEG